MIILHSAVLDTGLFLWAEAPANADVDLDTDVEAAQDGPAEAGGVGDYPFSADFDDLARAIRGLPVGFRPTRRRLKTANAWLPTQSGRPFPSSALIGEAPSGRTRVRMVPWRVEGLLLKPSEYYRLFTVYGERARELHGLVSGRDFAYWLGALRFAGANLFCRAGHSTYRSRRPRPRLGSGPPS